MKQFSFPFYRQIETMDCGPACLRMIAKYFGKDYTLDTLREKSNLDRQGVNLLGLSDAAEAIGLRTTAALATYDALVQENPLPAIVHWRNNHFVVLYKFRRKKAYIADPGHGLIGLSRNDFIRNWSGSIVDGEKEGMILMFAPSPEFYHLSYRREIAVKRGLKELLLYTVPYKKYIWQLLFAMTGGSVLQLAFPFLTQSIVDVGISARNIAFINIILLAQLMLFAGRTAGDFIRNWILLHMGTRINISMVSDFLAKLTKLPISFFDGKMTGDLIQRVSDHQRIQYFLTSSLTSTLFSFFNLTIFTCILLWYNVLIFCIFLTGSILYVLWILIFLKKRRAVDYQRFEAMSNSQSDLIQLIQGMQEIKMNNAERQNRWRWERVQARLFRISIRGLSLDQYQQIGSSFVNETKNIIITFIAAKAVISGSITLGMMLSVQYIIGQLNTPIADIITFIKGWQDASISLERVGEIFSRKNEEDPTVQNLSALPLCQSLNLRDVCFRYGGSQAPYVLKNVDLVIPEGKVTAIVGSSGSGKTTLLKLLLKFYPPDQGLITIGSHSLEHLHYGFWRSQCGVVMQDGFIFSDTIAKNIAAGEESINKTRLAEAMEIANIRTFIEELPLSVNTKIGNDGIGLSGGQRQRILIARAVYKNPAFLFFDEATSSLDAENEKLIMSNLLRYLKGRTAVIVAHRLSTVKNADQIIVLNHGEIVEQGTHEELTKAKKTYYSLIKNQLEFGV